MLRGTLLSVSLVVAVIGAALALNRSGGSSLTVLPPPLHDKHTSRPSLPPHVVGDGDDITAIVHPDLSHRGPIAAGEPPGTGALAGEPPAVLRRFAQLWANRSAGLGLQARKELIGLSGGAWARQVIRAIPLSLPSIADVGAQGSLVVFRFESSTPSSKTAVVLTKERLVGPTIDTGPYRYMVYIAQLDWLDANGYVVTGWEQQT